jgi:ADP-heptose:LPS heptosyltransferase
MAKIKAICSEILSRINNVEIHIISKNNTHYKRLKENLGSEKLIKIIEFRENILDIAALIKNTDLLISPNTFAIHFGSAFNIPTLAIYISEHTTISWGSLSSSHINIICNNSVENVKNSEFVKNTRTLLN